MRTLLFSCLYLLLEVESGGAVIFLNAGGKTDVDVEQRCLCQETTVF